jgi:hypothetical protein
MRSSLNQTPSMLSELASGEPIPLEKRAYFHARVLNNFHQYVLNKYLEEEEAGRLNKAELGRRIGKSAPVVSRLLGAPGNWGLETTTDLLLGICAEELQPSSSPLLNRPARNYDHWRALRLSSTSATNASTDLKVIVLRVGAGQSNFNKDDSATTSAKTQSNGIVYAPV